MKKFRKALNYVVFIIVLSVGVWTCATKMVDATFTAACWISKKIRCRRRKAVSVPEEEVDE